MPVHIFVVPEVNFEICIRRGLAAIPNSRSNPNISDGLISRMAMIQKGDLLLFYVVKKKELHGVYKVLERPFYDETQIWPENEDAQLYPYRVRIDNSDYTFKNPIRLNEIYDLRDRGIIWTFSLKRAIGSNVMFGISNAEYEELLKLFLKLNPIFALPKQIREPYQYFEPNLITKLNLDEGAPKYEYTVMALLLDGLANGEYKDIFGNYSDYLSYVPTSFEKEMDALLIYNNPSSEKEIIAYNILEVKRDVFDEAALSQILQYEDWFLKKKVNGDYTMLRTTAIARSFSDPVKEYLMKRKKYERKEMKLLQYNYTDGGFKLIPLGQ